MQCEYDGALQVTILAEYMHSHKSFIRLVVICRKLSSNMQLRGYPADTLPNLPLFDHRLVLRSARPTFSLHVQLAPL
jgi:hypothetical protein